MDEQQTVALVASFIGGFVMGFLRGFPWFGEGITYVLALAGGAVVTKILGADDAMAWTVGIMSHTLTIFGAIHVQGGLAKARANTNLPAAVMPNYSELGDKK